MRAERPQTLIILACAACLAPLLLLPLAWAEAQTDVWIKQDTGAARVLTMLWLPARSGALVSMKGAGLWFAAANGGWSRSSVGLPFTLDQGLSVIALAAVPTNPPALLALTSAGALYRSRDDGRQWEPASAPAGIGAAGILSAAPDGSLYLFVGADVYRSADAGSSWRSVGALPAGSRPLCAVSDLPAPADLLVGTEAGRILSSHDGGETWEQPEMYLARGRVQAIAGGPAGVLYAGTSLGLLRSNDQGKSWRLASPALQGQDVRAIVLAPGRSTTLYVGLGRNGVWRGSEDGERWESLGRGLARRSLVALVIDTAGRTLMTGAYDGVWRCRLPDAAAGKALLPMASTSTPTTSRPASAPSPSPIPTVIPTATASLTPSPEPTRTPTVTMLPTASATTTFTATSTLTSAPTQTQAPSPTLTPTATAMPTATQPPTREPAPTKEVTPPR